MSERGGSVRRKLGALVFGVVAAGLGGAALWLRATPVVDSPRGVQAAFFRGLPRPTNFAHRGASASAEENTMEAYRLALKQGADVVELDVRLLRDGTLVVAHDADLRRTAGLSVRLDEVSWPELQGMLAKAGRSVPLPFSQVLRALPGVRMNVEIKDPGPQAAASLAEVVAEAAAWDRVLVASMHHEALVAFRRRTGGRVATSASGREVLRLYLGYRLGYDAPAPFAALQLPPVPRLGLADPAFLRYAHGRGLVVHYWTIDDAERQRRLVEAGADGVMTNYPLVFQQTRQALLGGGLP